jgi:hypothetical protein
MAGSFGGKKFKIEIDSSIWREEIQNRNRNMHITNHPSPSSSFSIVDASMPPPQWQATSPLSSW